jgi:hypothetical protein
MLSDGIVIDCASTHGSRGRVAQLLISSSNPDLIHGPLQFYLLTPKKNKKPKKRRLSVECRTREKQKFVSEVAPLPSSRPSSLSQPKTFAALADGKPHYELSNFPKQTPNQRLHPDSNNLQLINCSPSSLQAHLKMSNTIIVPDVEPTAG